MKRLLVASGVRGGGNIQAENHREVVIKKRSVKGKVVRSTVEGSVQLEQGGGGRIVRTTVDSDIQLFSNRGQFTVRGNRVDGNLQCKANSPRPVGGNNVVQGNKEDQCRTLGAEHERTACLGTIVPGQRRSVATRVGTTAPRGSR